MFQGKLRFEKTSKLADIEENPEKSEPEETDPLTFQLLKEASMKLSYEQEKQIAPSEEPSEEAMMKVH